MERAKAFGKITSISGFARVYTGTTGFAVLQRLSDTMNILYLAQCPAHGSAQLACIAVIISIMTGDRELRRGQW